MGRAAYEQELQQLREKKRLLSMKVRVCSPEGSGAEAHVAAELDRLDAIRFAEKRAKEQARGEAEERGSQRIRDAQLHPVIEGYRVLGREKSFEQMSEAEQQAAAARQIPSFLV